MRAIGSVQVSNDSFGISRMIGDEEILSPPEPSIFNIWSITFAEIGCESGSWNLCPSNIRDLDNLVRDADQLSKSHSPSQEQDSSISVCEMKKGTLENNTEGEIDKQYINLSTDHSLPPGVGPMVRFRCICFKDNTYPSRVNFI